MLKFLNDDRILKILLLVIVIGNYFFKNELENLL